MPAGPGIRHLGALPAASGMEWGLPMAGQRLCGWRARRWVLQAPRPCALGQPHTPDPLPGIQPDALVGTRFRGDTANSAREELGVGSVKRRKVGLGAGPPEMRRPQHSGSRASCAFAALLRTLRFPWPRVEAAGAEICAAGGQEGCRRRGPLPAPQAHS